MGRGQYKLKVLTISVILLIVSILPVNGSEEMIDREMPIANHIPISIEDEDDLSDLISDEGWDGDGTSGDPYIIDDLHITLGTVSNGIVIKNTYSHIILSNLTFTGWMTGSWFLIYLDSVENVTVKDCDFADSPSPLQVDKSKNILVKDCSFKNHTYGIRALFPNENFTVNYCDFEGCGYGLIGSFSLISYCTFSNCSEGADLRYDDWMIHNCTFNDNYNSIRGYGNDYSIKDNNINSEGTGIQLSRSDSAKVIGNNISSKQFSAVYMMNCLNLIFYDNDINKGYFDIYGNTIEEYSSHKIASNNTVGGFPVHQYTNANMDNVSASSGFGQLIVTNVSWLSIDNNTVINSGNPVYIAHSSNISIADNYLVGSIYGLKCYQTKDLRIFRNNISRVSSYGIYIGLTSRTDVFENHLHLNDNCALYIGSGTEINIYDNHFNNNNWTSIMLSGNYATIRDNHILNGNYFGILISGSCTRNRIYRNDIWNNGQNGIKTYEGAPWNIIYENNISFNGKAGIDLYKSEDCFVFNNEFYGNKDFGIFLNDTLNAYVFSNRMYLDGINFKYYSGYSFSTSKMVNNNTLNGKPIRIYYGGSHSGYIMPKNTGQIILLGVTSMRISDMNISHACAGIVTKTSSSIIIQDSSFSHNSICGIMLTSSLNIQVIGCDFYQNVNGIWSNYGCGPDSGSQIFVECEFRDNSENGVKLNSHRNTVKDSVFSQNGLSGVYVSQCQENVIQGNTFTQNQYGVYFYWAYNGNRINRNLFFRNEKYGVWTYFDGTATQNEIILNVFIENNGATDVYNYQNPQAHDEYGSESWYSESEKGNYWSDWLSPDDNYDEMVDNPYPIGGGISFDEKPLTKHPFTILSRPLELEAVGGNGYINLSWNPPALNFGEEVTGYKIYRGEETKEQTLLTTIGSELSFNDTSVENGDQYFYFIKAINLFGIGNPSLEVNAWTDGTAPTLFISKPMGDAFINKNFTMIEWVSTDNIIGISHYTLTLDGEVLEDDLKETTYDLMDLQNGEHTVWISAFDRYYNVRSLSINFTIDVELPQVNITSPSEGSIINTTWVEFNWSGTDEFSGIQMYETRIDSGEWMYMGVDSSYAIEVPGDGEHNFQVRATDKANNSMISSINFEIDTELPTIDITSPTPGQYVQYEDIEIQWSASDELSGISHFLVSLNGEDFVNSDNMNNHFFTDLPQGRNVILIRGFDLADNFIDKEVYFIVDSEKPSIIDHSPTGEKVSKNAEIIVVFSEDLNSDMVTIDANGKMGQVFWEDRKMTFKPVSPWSGGATILVKITAIDLAGNEMHPFEWTFKADDTCFLTGIIMDSSGNPVSSANIIIDGVEMGSTESYGEFEINVTSGNHVITFRKSGFEDLIWTVYLEPGSIKEYSGSYMIKSSTGQDPIGNDPDEPNIMLFVIIGSIIVILLIVILIFIIVRSGRKKKEEPVEEIVDIDPFEKAEELRNLSKVKGLYIQHLEEKYNIALELKEQEKLEEGKERMDEYNQTLSLLVSEDPPLQDEMEIPQQDDISENGPDPIEPPEVDEELVNEDLFRSENSTIGDIMDEDQMQ